METWQAVVAAIGLVTAAVVADFHAITKELKLKTAGVFVVLGAAFTAFTAIYLPRLLEVITK